MFDSIFKMLDDLSLMPCFGAAEEVVVKPRLEMATKIRVPKEPDVISLWMDDGGGQE